MDTTGKGTKRMQEKNLNEKKNSNRAKYRKQKGQKKTVVCPSCGYEFDGTLAACPACGTMHYPGAEADYLEHLDDVKEQLQSLNKVHGKVDPCGSGSDTGSGSGVWRRIVLLGAPV